MTFTRPNGALRTDAPCLRKIKATRQRRPTSGGTGLRLATNRSWVAGLLAMVLMLLSSPAAEPKNPFPGLTLPTGFRASLWADETQVHNPIAMCFDGRGRMYAAEGHRRMTGVWGVTFSRWWSMEDYAGKTIEDRQAMYDRWAHIVPPAKLTRESERVRRLADTNGDGRADESVVFADGFNSPLDGNAAGIIEREGTVYLANIPHLWRLRDGDGDGVAEEREALFRGLGVRVGVHGHDLHGLTWGPDGRLYFSIGDRGFNLKSKEGRHLAAPTRGAAFRCFPDGSGLEVFHLGLRNPQELAFNQFGDLFTVDNDMGGADRCRVLRVTEGGDSGWDATYQLTRNFREETRREDHPEPPWFTEKLWELPHAAQPAWVNPPLGHLTSGPSGLAFDPGTGLPAEYRDTFFICDFKGSSPPSGVWSFRLETAGAGYRLAATNRFAGGVLPTDIEFGYDGHIYLTDWLSGWGDGGQRRVIRLTHESASDTAATREVARLFRDGWPARSVTELAALLGRADRRVAQAAQFQLATRGNAGMGAFERTARTATVQAARLRGVWGLWQIGLKTDLPASARGVLRGLLRDADAEIRAQAANVLGELRDGPVAAMLIAALDDASPRVRYFSALALGKLAHRPAVPPLLTLLERNADQDVDLRHAGVWALAAIGDEESLARCRAHPSVPVRRAAVLALRRLESPRLREFLPDAESTVVWETVRAIHDRGIEPGLEEVAALTTAEWFAAADTPFPIKHRVLNAGFRLGQREHAGRLARVAADERLMPAVRLEALRCLVHWREPSGFDRVTWHHRPLTGSRERKIEPAIAAEVLGVFASQRAAGGDAGLLRAATALLVRYDLAEAAMMRRLVIETSLDESARRAFFAKLSASPDAEFMAACVTLAGQGSSVIAVEAAAFLHERGHGSGPGFLASVWQNGAVPLRQLVLRRLAVQTNAFALLLVRRAVAAELAAESPGELAVELFETATRSTDAELARNALRWRQTLTNRAPLGVHQLALNGGDAGNGRRLFSQHAAQCVRCHAIKGFGGDAGPDLSRIGRELKRPDIVLALLEPSARIAPGFGTHEFELKDGESVAGFIKRETAVTVEVQTMDGRLLGLAKSGINRRSEPVSGMPSMREVLTLSEVRDLAAYLSGLK